jgi:hypothetical protein
MSMQLYDVVVRNEHTGEMVTLSVESSIGADAQVQALHELFHARGWSKATALSPVAREMLGEE